jgi:hypothetical protein
MYELGQKTCAEKKFDAGVSNTLPTLETINDLCVIMYMNFM